MAPSKEGDEIRADLRRGFFRDDQQRFVRGIFRIRVKQMEGGVAEDEIVRRDGGGDGRNGSRDALHVQQGGEARFGRSRVMEPLRKLDGGFFVLDVARKFRDGGDGAVPLRAFGLRENVEELVRDNWIADFRQGVHNGNPLVWRDLINDAKQNRRGGRGLEPREGGDIFEGDGIVRLRGGVDERLRGGGRADGRQRHDGVGADGGIAQLGGDGGNLPVVRAEPQQLENRALGVVVLYFFHQSVRHGLGDDVAVVRRVGDERREGVCRACVFR